LTDSELLRLVARYTLAQFKKAPEAPQYREVLRRFGSWSAAKALCGDWDRLGPEACVYVARVEEGIVKIGTCHRKSWLLGYPVQLLSYWEASTETCIAVEVQLKRQAGAVQVEPTPRCVRIGNNNGYYLEGPR